MREEVEIFAEDVDASDSVVRTEDEEPPSEVEEVLTEDTIVVVAEPNALNSGHEGPVASSETERTLQIPDESSDPPAPTNAMGLDALEVDILEVSESKPALEHPYEKIIEGSRVPSQALVLTTTDKILGEVGEDLGHKPTLMDEVTSEPVFLIPQEAMDEDTSYITEEVPLHTTVDEAEEEESVKHEKDLVVVIEDEMLESIEVKPTDVTELKVTEKTTQELDVQPEEETVTREDILEDTGRFPAEGEPDEDRMETSTAEEPAERGTTEDVGTLEAPLKRGDNLEANLTERESQPGPETVQKVEPTEDVAKKEEPTREPVQESELVERITEEKKPAQEAEREIVSDEDETQEAAGGELLEVSEEITSDTPLVILEKVSETITDNAMQVTEHASEGLESSSFPEGPSETTLKDVTSEHQRIVTTEGGVTEEVPYELPREPFLEEDAPGEDLSVEGISSDVTEAPVDAMEVTTKYVIEYNNGNFPDLTVWPRDVDDDHTLENAVSSCIRSVQGPLVHDTSS